MLSAPEEAEFWTFYRKTSEALFRKAYRMCHGHQADADDAQQRTYLKALAHWGTVSGLDDRKRSAWLATTLAREVLQMWRAGYRTRETATGGDVGEQPVGPAGADIVEAVYAADRFYEVCQAIAGLKGRQREVVALHCVAGYEISEVAEMLEISENTVRVHLCNGRRSLVRAMTERRDSPHGSA